MTRTPPTTTPMPQIRSALLSVMDAHAATNRALAAWNAEQLRDAIRSARHFLDVAEARLESEAQR